MKIRSGFVSNSSSSSFAINKYYLSQFQVEAIYNHVEYADELGLYPEPWDIFETEEELRGDCFMDNFDMARFFEFIHIDPQWVSWDGEQARRPFGQ